MDIKKLKAEVIEEIKQENERAVKHQIRSIIDGIIREQGIVKAATKKIEELQATLKAFEAPDEIVAKDIL